MRVFDVKICRKIGKKKRCTRCNPIADSFVNLSFKSEVFYKECILKNFCKIHRKTLCQSLFFSKVAGLRPASLLKRYSDTGVFLWILQSFLRRPFLQNTSVDDCFCKLFAYCTLRKRKHHKSFKLVWRFINSMTGGVPWKWIRKMYCLKKKLTRTKQNKWTLHEYINDVYFFCAA